MAVVKTLFDAARRSRTAPVTGRRAAVHWRHVRQAGRRLSWGVADQAVSSLTNFAVSIYIARSLGAAQYGAFSLAYVTYGFALNASRGLATDPLLVRFSGTDVPTWRRAVAPCTGAAAATGLGAGICVLAAAIFLHGPTRSAFLALGLTLPALLLQDSWRYAFFALGRGIQAFINDVIWAVVLLPALVLLRATGHANVFWFVFAWGAAAGAGAAAGPIQARVVPRLSGTREWLSQHRDLGFRYLAEGTSNSAAAQLRNYGVGLILGLAALGYLQAASTLMGPFQVVLYGMGLVALPEAARILRRSPQHMPAFCVLFTIALTLLGLAWGVILLVALPRGLGQWMLGSLWRPTYPLVLPTTLFVMGGCASSGAGMWLHALGAARRSLRAAMLTSVAYVVCSLAGAFAGGAVGSIRGAAAGTWIGAAMYWWQLRKALQEPSQAAAAPETGQVAAPQETGQAPAPQHSGQAAAPWETGDIPSGYRSKPARPSGRNRSAPGIAFGSPDDITMPLPLIRGDEITLPLFLLPTAAGTMPPEPAAQVEPPSGQGAADDPTIILPAVRPVKSHREAGKPAAALRAGLAAGALALLGAAAATGWILTHEPSASGYTGAPATERASKSTSAPAPVPVTARAVTPVSAVSFDPYGGGPDESNQLAPYAIDTSPGTAWYATAGFGNLKPGTGLLLDMGRPVTITNVRLLLGSIRGADLQVRTGERASSLSDLTPDGSAADAGGQEDVPFSKPAQARFVLIWFTRLPPDPDGTFRASVYNVSLDGGG